MSLVIVGSAAVCYRLDWHGYDPSIYRDDPDNLIDIDVIGTADMFLKYIQYGLAPTDIMMYETGSSSVATILAAIDILHPTNNMSEAMVDTWELINPDADNAVREIYKITLTDGTIVEWEIAEPGSAGLEFIEMINGPIATLPALYLLKLTHRYLKNSPHFYKTMRDIKFLRQRLGELRWSITDLEEEFAEWIAHREAETYTYLHPNLDRTKEEFFADDGLTYYFDHDSIHAAVALDGAPAYTHFQKEGSEVLSDMDKFFELDHQIRLNAAAEESMVLTMERSLVPHFIVQGKEREITPYLEWMMWRFAFMKVCTSITSGHFREWCWEHHDEVCAMMQNQIRAGRGPFSRFMDGVLDGTVQQLIDF